MCPTRATRVFWIAAALTVVGGPGAQAAAQEASLRFDTPPVPLSQPIVTSLLQDVDGFVWIGTQGGLVRYDGQNTRVYRAVRGTTPPPLPSSAVRAAIEHSDGRIWVATLGGLAIVSQDRTEVAALTSESHPHLFGFSDALSDLSEFPDGRVAVGVDGGGVVILDASGTSGEVFLHDPRDPGTISSNAVESVLAAPDGRLWVGGRGGLSYRPPGGTGFVRVSLPATGPEGAQDDARRLALSPDGHLWIGGLDGMVRLDPATGEISDVRLRGARVQAILIETPDRIWVGTYGQGLHLLDGEGNVLSVHADGLGRPQTLRDSRVSALLLDRTGLLWVGLWGRGVQTADPLGGAFHFLPTGDVISGEDVTSIRRDPAEGGMLVTTYSAGVDLLSDAGALRTALGDVTGPAALAPTEALTALRLPDGDLLVGRVRVGLDRVDPQGGVRTYVADPLDPTAIPDAPAYALAEDHSGRIWVGTGFGLRRFDPVTGAFHRPDVSGAGGVLGSAFVRSIHVAPDSLLWIGTLGQGLFIHDPDRAHTLRIDTGRFPDQLTDDEVAAVTTQAGAGWFGTRSAGTLHRVTGFGSDDALRVETLGPPTGLGQAVQCLTTDREGRVWGSSTSQILSITPATLEVRTYGPADGVPDGEFRTASCALGGDGRLWFGQQTGVTVFRPDEVDRPRPRAPTVIGSAVFAGREVEPLALQEPPTLAYRGGLISFRLAVLEYRDPRAHSFVYRLNNGPWTSLGQEATVTFANLLPGSYVLEAAGRDAHGTPALPTPPFAFRVLAPFHMTTWFRALLPLVAALLLLGLYGWRTRTVRAHNVALQAEIERRERLEEEREGLEAQLRQSQKMEAVGRLTGGIAHDFNNILTVLHGNTDLLRETTSDPDSLPLVEEIGRAASRATDLVAHLLVFARKKPLVTARTDLAELLRLLEPLLRRTLEERIDVVLELEHEVPPVVLDPAQFESAVINLAINARDAIPTEGRLTLALGLRNVLVPTPDGIPAGRWVVLDVRDTGTGMPPDVLERVFEPFFTTKEVGKGSGLGLSMVYGFVESSGGHVRVESEAGEGARFLLFFPPAF